MIFRPRREPEHRAGDTVQVRSRAEIKRLLASGGKARGCSFTHEMYKYCGREFRVLKSVETFFDESKQKMCKCRNTVLLDGAVCSGRQRLYFMKCDRNCFFSGRRSGSRRSAEEPCS